MNLPTIKYLVILIFLENCLYVQAQFKIPQGYAETELTGSFGKELPFWMVKIDFLDTL